MLRSNVNRVNDGRLDGRLFYWEKQNERALEYAPGGITGIGGWLGYFLGGCDGLLYALIAFTVIDYISGVMCGIVDNNLSNSIGFKGICRKVIVFMLVGVAIILDTRIFQTGSVLRTAVIFFYLQTKASVFL
jgi:toxin secretion/phage lysis holin